MKPWNMTDETDEDEGFDGQSAIDIDNNQNIQDGHNETV